MNKRKMKQLATVLDSVKPSAYDQNSWCGSAACAAGHTLLALGDKNQKKVMLVAEMMASIGVDVCEISDIIEPLMNVEGEAAAILGLEQSEANALFACGDDWPTEYKTRTGKVTPKLAARRVRDIVDGSHELSRSYSDDCF